MSERTSESSSGASVGSTAQPVVGLLRTPDRLGVIALRPIPAGRVLLCSAGVIVRKPSRYSVQIGERSHIELPADIDPLAASEAGLWRFLNHSCSPSARFEGPDLLAARDVAEGEEITFNYNTTEYELAEPFRCQCGTCDGTWIGGFKTTSLQERARIEPNLAPHLRRRMV